MLFRKSHGMSLVELMIAVAILSIGILGLIGSFRFISKAIRVSRARTLATNLAQEKVENLKNLSYYKLLVTTSTTVDGNFSPAIVYDNSNYPPETISIGGITFKRGVYTAFVQVDNNVISTFTANYPDTGMKLVRVHVLWQDEGVWKKITLNNLYENPYVNALDSTITGTVNKAGGGALTGAKVSVVENPDWNGTSNASGQYSFSVYHGSYTIRASSGGYYDATSSLVSVANSSSVTVDFTLNAIGSGTIAGSIWVSSNLVISQVVAATNTLVANGSFQDVEYVELFNPTTYPINIGSGATYNIKVGYKRNSGDGGTNFCGSEETLTFVSTYVAPGKYYLLANATSFQILGTQIDTDAYWDDVLYENRMRENQSGCIYLTTDCTSSTNRIDAVAWTNNGGASPPADCIETLAIPLTGQGGLATGNQIVRISSPLLTSTIYGKAYDADANIVDFLYPYSSFSGLVYRPYTTSNSSQTVISGRPVPGANITANDLLGPSTQSYIAYVTSGVYLIPHAPFSLVGISTGTWDVVVASGSYFKQISGVVIAQNATTLLPNASTNPSWILAGNPAVLLDSSTLNGYISGSVKDTANNAISNIQVTAAGVSKLTASNGRYFMSVTSGPVTLVANPGNANGTYVESIILVTVETGQVLTQNFTLSQGGVLKGYATSGTSVLPNIPFTANIGGSQYGSGTTDSSGTFYIKNLTTGTYTVQPVLDPAETSSPESITATLSSTGTVTIGTFTITGALGTLSGNLTYNGELLTTGGLILASTSTIPATPSAIVASSSPAQAILYAASSKADGSYELEVRGSTTSTYNVSAYIPVITGTSVSITTKTYTGISVAPSGSTSLNITVP